LIQINAASATVQQSRAICWEKTVVPRRSEHDLTDDAPASRRYELLNIFGTATGEAVSASESERLPAVPLGYSWRLVAVDEPREVARLRVLEVEKRIARQDFLVRQMEQNGETVIADIGRSLLRAFQGSLQAANNYLEHLKAFPP
jgi:hypothetical protein